ncbi:hypothetical protein, partial [Streptomyces sp. CNQ085]|uniref:hypothetical protein n=1 Tax=Streptomyces sp. CNQ085 TaxID=2886944 RepID=UPI001F50D4A9
LDAPSVTSRAVAATTDGSESGTSVYSSMICGEGAGAAAGRGARLRALLLPRSAVRAVWAFSERWSAVSGRWSGAVGRIRGRVRRPRQRA